MRLTVVGCSGSVPGPDSAASCYLLECEGTRVLLDLGNGAIGPLARYGSVHDIDAILLSHLHADHCIDLTCYYVARKYAPGGPRPPVAVYGPRGTARRILRAYDTTSAKSLAAVFQFAEYPPAAPGGAASQPFELGPFRVSVIPVAHPVPAFAIRVAVGDRCVVYSGDTGPTPNLVELSAGADIALFEASCLTGQDNPPDLHLTAGQAAEHAARAGAGRLVLTHLVPWNDPADSLTEASRVFGGPTEIARTGMVIEI